MKLEAAIRRLKVWSTLLFILSLLAIQSCVSEDDLDLPDINDETELRESTAIVSTLRAIENGTLREDGCFQILFPLKLQFNNSITISITDFAGLNEAAVNATSDQHISAIEFPFIVTKNDLIKNIENEQDFTNLLDDCEILTLRDEFDPFYTQCFDLVYPVTMLDIDSNQVVIDNQSAYFDFEFQQGFDKQPTFEYPIEVFNYAEEETTLIKSSFDLFEVFDSCGECPELFFRIDTVSINRFVFQADFERISEIPYDWYINNEKVESDGGSDDADNRLTETFPSGQFEICIKSTLPNDDCFSGTEYCKMITVDACPFVSFETDTINSNTFKFIANFETKDLLDYYWAIYKNDDLIFSELEDSSGDDELLYQFDVGTYEVCLEAEVDQCPEVLRSCIELIVD
ncbi:hypothetical protein [Ekhidna sp. To15]|uniref:hypothetical protein n=1 Tax=Ekhidna sp. To15 TaxID=3395267 RepID=UPI003F525D6A